MPQLVSEGETWASNDAVSEAWSGGRRMLTYENLVGLARPCLKQPKPGDAARKIIMARADKRAAGLRPTIEALQASGVTSLQGMAAALNEASIPTPRGKRQWHPVQVRRLLARLWRGTK
jgi:hypothetical protein